MEITQDELKVIEKALRDNLRMYQYKDEFALLNALRIVFEIKKRRDEK